jgi:anti-anti-sigma factor
MPGAEDQLSVVSGVRAGCRVVVASGDLDGDTAGELDRLLAALPAGLGVLLDLAGLRMLTSAGVHVLLQPRAFGHPAIFCPDGPVSRVLEIVQAHRLVPIYRDLDAALKSLGAAA